MKTDYLTLREKFRTGIAPVDEQHREMIECYNDLERAVASGAPEKARVDALASLAEATRVHFRFEEDLLEA
ncbi:MAG: hemerythrin, partial [Gammaproteobacteria bacterium]|nr:hemerythrin [Gammaproteobacteria bacterium]